MICRSFNRVICCMHRKSFMKRLVLLLLNLCMIKDGIMVPTQVLIDNEHLAEYPYCGSMNYEGSQYSGSPIQQEGCVGCMGRAVNANYSSDSTQYRWLVLLEMRNMNANGVVEHSTCTGSVITDR